MFSQIIMGNIPESSLSVPKIGLKKFLNYRKVISTRIVSNN